ncbi:rh50 [Anaeramoeba flamelloides]|uniref:Rh50 n=1 Tax=Anaeramoeba flamelloides TaxID=1746091 RepID=A0ABQ8YQQ0_9EUKA|nr:rh50 [Anaeramoeba flamelloides]
MKKNWESDGHQKAFVTLLVVLQIFMLVIVGVWFRYDESFDETEEHDWDHRVDYYYSYYSDVAVMVIIGFGYLMAFLKFYGKSAVGYTFLLTGFCVQWVMIVNAFFIQTHDDEFTYYKVTLHSLIEGMFGAAAVMITFGAVLGRTTPFQLLMVAFFEIIFYGLNIYINVLNIELIDIGGSLIIHTFGAYFGIGLTWVLTPKLKNFPEEHPEDGSTKTSDLFSLFGTIFLWLFWPSFNGALGTPGNRFRVIINTVLSLCGSCVFSFLMSALLNKGKFNAVDIQNATLAGGVAVGSSANLYITPVGAMGVGSLAGAISTLGFNKLTPFLRKHLGIQDTCGVHNLHGIPGLIGGIVSIIAASAAKNDHSLYNGAYDSIFSKGDDQPVAQVKSLFVTLGMALGGGLVTGLIIKLMKDNANTPFNDQEYWEEGIVKKKNSNKTKKQFKNINAEIIKSQSESGSNSDKELSNSNSDQESNKSNSDKELIQKSDDNDSDDSEKNNSPSTSSHSTHNLSDNSSNSSSKTSSSHHNSSSNHNSSSD